MLNFDFIFLRIFARFIFRPKLSCHVLELFDNFKNEKKNIGH